MTKFEIVHGTVTDALGKARTGWLIVEDGRPGYPYSTRDNAEKAMHGIMVLRGLVPPVAPEPAPTPTPDPNPNRPMLGENAEEAQRILVGGRRTDLLKEGKHFDSDRLANSPLFDRKLF